MGIVGGKGQHGNVGRAAGNYVVTPAGLRINNPIPGLLQFLVGIQANESGFDYFRAQGSPSGSTLPPSASVGGGYGAYQFQVGTSQWQQANAAGWNPQVQDKIAAGMAQGYYNEFKGLAQKNGVSPWQYVAEAWYGPGTVPQSPIAPSSVPDVANVLNAERGHASLPSAWTFGPGHHGLTVAEIRAELAGHPASSTPGGAPGGSSTPATLTSWWRTLFGAQLGGLLFGPGGIGVGAAAGSGVTPSRLASGLFSGFAHVAFLIFGIILIVWGISITFRAGDKIEIAGKDAEKAAPAAAA